MFKIWAGRVLNLQDLDYAKILNFSRFGLCLILTFLFFQDLNYAKYLILNIWTKLNIEFWRFGLCQILNFQHIDYVKYWILKIWTWYSSNLENSIISIVQMLQNSIFGIVQILNIQYLAHSKSLKFNIWHSSNLLNSIFGMV